MDTQTKQKSSHENSVKKNYDNSTITLENRKNLTLTGVEKVYEASENKVQVCVAGSNLAILGSDLSITKIDVGNGTLNLVGNVDGLKFMGENSKNIGKGNFLKRIFK